MEQHLEQELQIETKDFVDLFSSLSGHFLHWKKNVEEQQKVLSTFSNFLQSRSAEYQTVKNKLEYAKEFMVNAAKKEEKIKAKQQKYLNEKSLDKWDNP